MRTIVMTLLMAGAALAQNPKADIIKLSQAGCSDELILSFVRSKGGAPSFTVDEIAEMKTAGVRDSVLSALISGKAAPPPAPPPQPVYIPPPQTTVVYEYYPAPPAYYYHCDPYWYDPYPFHFGFSYGHFGRRHGYGFGIWR